MSSNLCKRCDCAIAIGVPLRDRSGRPAVITEPPSFTWRDVEFSLALFERALRDEPPLHDHVMSLVHKMVRFANGMSGPMPDAVRATFTRLGISNADGTTAADSSRAARRPG